VCADNSWIHGKCRQRFYHTFTNVFLFFHVFYVLNVFLKFISERVWHLRGQLLHHALTTQQLSSLALTPAVTLSSWRGRWKWNRHENDGHEVGGHDTDGHENAGHVSGVWIGLHGIDFYLAVLPCRMQNARYCFRYIWYFLIFIYLIFSLILDIVAF